MSAKVEGLESLLTKVKDLVTKSLKQDGAQVVVGYDKPYAIFVHENLEAIHKSGSAKFLEQPAKTMKAELAKTILNVKERGGTTEEALLAAGQRLLDASKQLVPVDTGALRESGFVKVERS